MAVGRLIEQFIKRMADLGDDGEFFRRYANLEMIRVIALEQQRGDQRNQIGVAAALAQSVQRALNMPRPRPHRRQRIGDRVLGVVMGVDAQMRAGHMLRHFAHDTLDLVGQRSPIGVAEHHPARP